VITLTEERKLQAGRQSAQENMWT